MNIKQFTFNPFQENTFVIYAENKEAIIIDPGFYDKKEKECFFDFIKENKIDKTGFHLQGGLKFQLMMLDAFLFYRQTFGDFEDVKDAKTYGSFNFRVGMAI